MLKNFLHKKNTKKIPRNYMDAVILHNPKYNWKENDEGIAVIDVINKGPHHRFAQKFFGKPKVSHISLDKYGSVLWKAIDGHNTVYDIVNIMKTTFPDEEERMLDRVINFMHTLQVNGFVMLKHQQE